MQIYYTVFDREENGKYPMGRVGLAKAKHTQPEIITHWDANGKYVDNEIVCEESYIDKTICDNYQE